jgi:hypothetical protein
VPVALPQQLPQIRSLNKFSGCARATRCVSSLAEVAVAASAAALTAAGRRGGLPGLCKILYTRPQLTRPEVFLPQLSGRGKYLPRMAEKIFLNPQVSSGLYYAPLEAASWKSPWRLGMTLSEPLGSFRSGMLRVLQSHSAVERISAAEAEEYSTPTSCL